jgi:hypothetical protein
MKFALKSHFVEGIIKAKITFDFVPRIYCYCLHFQFHQVAVDRKRNYKKNHNEKVVNTDDKKQMVVMTKKRTRRRRE